jgi:hypothetical protein
MLFQGLATQLASGISVPIAELGFDERWSQYRYFLLSNNGIFLNYFKSFHEL